jgi:flagellar biosynthesis protein FlhG
MSEAEMDGTPQPNSSSRVISVGGGKGGVGKSILSANLAVALAQTGRRVVLVDLDLGGANQQLLLGVTSCRPGIPALIEGTEADVREALTPTGISNLSLLAGTETVQGAANISHQSQQRLLRKLRSLDATVVLDAGAGVGYNALDFFLLGAQRLIVTTPQVTAIHDAYSFLKGAVLRLVQQQAERTIEAKLLEPILEPILATGESLKVAQLIERMREQHPGVADKIATLVRSFNASLVGNQVVQASDGGVFWSVSRMMREFLGVDVPVLGYLSSASVVDDSVNDRRPFVLGRPCEQARAICKMAEALMAQDVSDDLEAEPVAAPAVAAVPVVRLPTPAPVPRSLRRHPTLPGMTPRPRAGTVR